MLVSPVLKFGFEEQFEETERGCEVFKSEYRKCQSIFSQNSSRLFHFLCNPFRLSVKMYQLRQVGIKSKLSRSLSYQLVLNNNLVLVEFSPPRCFFSPFLQISEHVTLQ